MVRFNPCFSGCRPATQPAHALDITGCMSFNPCFSGCRPATPCSCPIPSANLCFNPCFSGCRPATLTPSREVLIWIQVSILVLVDAALRLDCHLCPRCIEICVSILVLVDAALRLSFAVKIIVAWLSFNPCFSGCRPATQYIHH